MSRPGDLNPAPTVYDTVALPDELGRQCFYYKLKTTDHKPFRSPYCTPLEPILAKIPNDLPRAARVAMRYQIVRIGVRDDSQTPPSASASAPALRPRPVSALILFFFRGGIFQKLNGRKTGLGRPSPRKVKVGRLPMRCLVTYSCLYWRSWLKGWHPRHPPRAISARATSA